MNAVPPLHRLSIVVDAHNDSLDRRLSRGDALDLAPANAAYQVDLPRLREGGVTALFSYSGSTALPKALQLLDATHQMVATHPHEFLLFDRATDIAAAKTSGRIAIVCQLESLSCCMGSLGVLRALHRLGVRVGNLTHGEALAHSCQAEESVFGYCAPADRERMRREQAGLTDFGRATIREMNDLGMLVDLAHINDAAFYQALEVSATAPIFSHGGVFALCPHSRGLTDDQIRALAERGGVHGVACYAKFIHQDNPTLPALVDQIEHSINLVGPDHVGLGADFDGIGDDGVAIPADVSGLPRITAEMVSRGWGEGTIRRVLGANFCRVLAEALA